MTNQPRFRSLPPASVPWLPRWMARAACAGLATRDSDIWHPDSRAKVQDIPASHFDAARAVCLGCPVQVDCARYGLELVNEMPVQGMFGGMTPKELRKLARQLGRSSRKVARHGTRTRYVNFSCRCEPCAAANRAGERQRRIGVRGRPEGDDSCSAWLADLQRHCWNPPHPGSLYCGTHADQAAASWAARAASERAAAS